MVFPIIPILGAAAVITGVGSIVWYSRLTPEEREVADRHANALAMEWFGIALDKLDKVRFLKILASVKLQTTSKQDSLPPDEDPPTPRTPQRT